MKKKKKEKNTKNESYTEDNNYNSPSSETGSSRLKGCEGNCGLAESNGSPPPGL